MPEEDGAVLAARHDVAVAGVVALGPGQAGHHAPVAEDDLSDLGCLRGEDPETVVPEPGSDYKPTVHGGNECVGSHLDLLGEIISEVPSCLERREKKIKLHLPEEGLTDLLSRGVGDNGQDGVHGEREVDVTRSVVRIAGGLGGG